MEGLTKVSGAPPAPLRFFYTHLHDAIKAELESLSQFLRALDISGEVDSSLLQLKRRYRFLEQVYKYHSNVEDEVSEADPFSSFLQD